MTVSLDWLGVSTYRLVVDDLVIFLDAYIDRNPLATPVGMTVSDVQRADYVLVGHSHFDHLWGAERIALQTGGTIIGSHESVRLMEIEGVPNRTVSCRRGRGTGQAVRQRICSGVSQSALMHMEHHRNFGTGLLGRPGLNAGRTAREPRQTGSPSLLIQRARDGGGRSPQNGVRSATAWRRRRAGILYRDATWAAYFGKTHRGIGPGFCATFGLTWRCSPRPAGAT